MSAEPQDPFESPWMGGQALTVGKQLHEALLEQPHFRLAARALDQLGEGDLRRLAFYVAAEEIAKGVEQLGSMDPWMEWWRGIDSPGRKDPSAMDTTPLQLWRIMRPPTEDEADSRA
jgi:hypothetical protein